MPFKFEKTEIPEVIYVEASTISDNRGAFSEMYKRSEFQANGIPNDFVQTNISQSSKGTLRGLHYQLAPTAQGKLVSVLKGEIFDVGVDARQGSPTYGQWVGRKLSAEKRNMLYIPEGFAHGFSVLSDSAEVLYYCTHEYAPEYDRGIIWNDKTLNIDWHIDNPVLSDKDNQLPTFEEVEKNFVYK